MSKNCFAMSVVPKADKKGASGVLAFLQFAPGMVAADVVMQTVQQAVSGILTYVGDDTIDTLTFHGHNYEIVNDAGQTVGFEFQFGNEGVRWSTFSQFSKTFEKLRPKLGPESKVVFRHCQAANACDLMTLFAKCFNCPVYGWTGMTSAFGANTTGAKKGFFPDGKVITV